MSLRSKLRDRETVVGTFTTIAAPGFVEVCGIAGFDFVVIDMEHAALGFGEAENLVRAAELRSTQPLIRVASQSAHDILRALDTGAVGVHVPNVSSEQEGRWVVAHSKYGPAGDRGLAGVRASGYGLLESLSSYAERANNDTVVVAHIENAGAIARLDEILSVEGIDVYYLGPVDLSNDLGVPGRTLDPQVTGLIERAISQIAEAGKVAGCVVNDLDAVRRYSSLGATYFACHALRIMGKEAERFVKSVREV